MNKLIFFTTVIIFFIFISPKASNYNKVLLSSDNTNKILLSDEWKFKYIPSSTVGTDSLFYNNSFDISSWKSIPVPSHWELDGFAEPQYKKVEEGTGLYRTTFKLPSYWLKQRVMLRFEGVLYGFTVWINGNNVGEWASSYNPVTFDITDALKPGENIIAVRVTTRSKGYEFDTNDAWALSGIYREVFLFLVPNIHFTDFTSSTILTNNDAELNLSVKANGGKSVIGKLYSPDNKLEKEFNIHISSQGNGSLKISVQNPKLWTAETPNLYKVELKLKDRNKILQSYTTKIGLRQITISDRTLKLNGVPIKLRGIDHHDIWPLGGRVATEESMKRDLEMIKQANINFIRTSHYPPHPGFIELCDEMGIYVMCEVPFGYGDKHLTDTSYTNILLTRAEATVNRDKNHPSVIVWSIGNENPLTELSLKTAQRTKELDPTRPVCFPTVGSYFRKNIQKFIDLPEFIELFSPHYPNINTIKEYAEKLNRPIIFTEYAHALGLATGRIQDEWELMQSSPRVAGGAIWMFQDQGILRTSKEAVDTTKQTYYVWKDPYHYYDTFKTDGVDGIVYSDRTPQVDYWEVKQVYSPVQVNENRLNVHSGLQELRIHFENRYDFIDLSKIKMKWSFISNSKSIKTGTEKLNTKPHSSDSIKIKIDLPEQFKNNINVLKLKFIDDQGYNFYGRSIRLNYVGGQSFSQILFETLKGKSKTEISDDGTDIKIVHDKFSLRLNKSDGNLKLFGKDGSLIANSFLPHVGRKFTMAEELRAKKSSIWKEDCLKLVTLNSAKADYVEGGVKIQISGEYCRAEFPQQKIIDESIINVSDKGTIEVNFNFTPLNADGELLEAGLSIKVPLEFTEFRWIGEGPYPGYPGKDKLDQFGIYHLNSQDINYQGNRRNVELALLTNSKGKGLLINCEPSDIAVENNNDGINLSYNSIISGRGNKGREPETNVDISKVKQISGKFIIIPLDSNWTKNLQNWFGKTDNKVIPFKPFYDSYDQ